jgi:hypothetical protein
MLDLAVKLCIYFPFKLFIHSYYKGKSDFLGFCLDNISEFFVLRPLLG